MTDEIEDAAETEQSEEQRKHDIETLRQLHSDAQRVLDEHIDSITDLSNKSIKLAQVDGVILSIVVGAATRTGTDTYINPITILGFVFILFSFLISVWAYSVTKAEIGIGEGVVETTIDEKPTEKEYLYWILSGIYTETLGDLEEKIEYKSKLVDWSIYFFLIGFLGLLAGILYSVGV